MAIQSEFFSTSFGIRSFSSTKHIATKQHMAVWLKKVSDDLWTQLSVNKFELINNSAVLTEVPSSILYSQVEIRVADEPDELGSSQSDIAVVASIATQLQEIVDTVVPNLPDILLADDNAATATAQANIATTQAGIASTKATEASTSANNALTSEQNADISEANALTYKTEAESARDLAIGAKDTATTQAGIATTKAGEASSSATLAQGYAESINPSILVHKDSDTGVAYLPSGTTAQRPTLAVGVKAIRYNTDLVSFEGWNGTSWGSIGGGAKGGSTDKVFFENDQVVTADYTITAGKNAMTAGTITINNGVTVTVPSGSTWVVL